jgi:hypothetical protein
MNLGEEVKKVIVFEHENQVHIYKCEEDLPEGSAVSMNQNDKEPKSTEQA